MNCIILATKYKGIYGKNQRRGLIELPILPSYQNTSGDDKTYPAFTTQEWRTYIYSKIRPLYNGSSWIFLHVLAYPPALYYPGRPVNILKTLIIVIVSFESHFGPLFLSSLLVHWFIFV